MVLALSGLATVATGSAATLGGLAPPPLGVGDAVVLPCDPDGMTISYSTSGGSVTAVTVGEIADPRCEGGAVSLVLRDASGSQIAAAGPRVVSADSDTVANVETLALAPQPPAEQVAGIATQIVGP